MHPQHSGGPDMEPRSGVGGSRGCSEAGRCWCREGVGVGKMSESVGVGKVSASGRCWSREDLETEGVGGGGISAAPVVDLLRRPLRLVPAPCGWCWWLNC